jgi:hypothetical protein
MLFPFHLEKNNMRSFRKYLLAQQYKKKLMALLDVARKTAMVNKRKDKLGCRSVKSGMMYVQVADKQVNGTFKITIKEATRISIKVMLLSWAVFPCFAERVRCDFRWLRRLVIITMLRIKMTKIAS